MRGGRAVIAAAMKVGHLRCVSWMALVAVLLRTVEVVYGAGGREHCPNLRTVCDFNAASTVLGSLTSDNASQTLMCTAGTVGRFFWYRTKTSTDRTERQAIINNGSSKFMFEGQNDDRLTVNDVSVADEGRYFCLVDNMGEPQSVTCLLAYVPAKFETCPGGQSETRVGCMQREMIDVGTEEESVEFDVSLTHEDVQGSCYNQTIMSITFTKESALGNSSVTLTCNDVDCILLTGSDTRFRAERNGTSGYDIAIRLYNLTVSDSGNYSVRAQVLEAGESIMFCIYKNFTLSVKVPTTQPPTTADTTASSSSSGSGLSPEVLASIVVVFVVLFIPLVVLIIAVVLLCSLTCYRRQQEKKKSEALYDSPEQAFQKNGSSIRKLLGSNQPPDSVSMRSQNEADGVGELSPHFNSEDQTVTI